MHETFSFVRVLILVVCFAWNKYLWEIIASESFAFMIIITHLKATHYYLVPIIYVSTNINLSEGIDNL